MKISTQAQLEEWIKKLSLIEITSLTTLNLWNTQVADVTPLAALTSLNELRPPANNRVKTKKEGDRK